MSDIIYNEIAGEIVNLSETITISESDNDESSIEAINEELIAIISSDTILVNKLSDSDILRLSTIISELLQGINADNVSLKSVNW